MRRIKRCKQQSIVNFTQFNHATLLSAKDEQIATKLLPLVVVEHCNPVSTYHLVYAEHGASDGAAELNCHNKLQWELFYIG